MTWLVQDWMAPIVQREARKAASAFRHQGWTVDDLVNEFYVWMHENPRRGWDQMFKDDERDVAYFGATAYYEMRDFIKRDALYRVSGMDDRHASLTPVGGVVSDTATPAEVDLDLEAGGEEGKSYTRSELEALIPGIWSIDVAVYGVQSEVQRDPEMPKGQGPNPAHGFTAAAKVADVKRAWERADLTLRQRQCVLLRYGADMKVADAGDTLGINQSKVSEHTSEGVTRMLAYLNG